MRKKKDMELTLQELNKQNQLQEEIEEKRDYLKLLQAKSNKISQKVRAMKKFDDFLEKVKDRNPDQFTELQDIVSRYK